MEINGGRTIACKKCKVILNMNALNGLLYLDDGIEKDCIKECIKEENKNLNYETLEKMFNDLNNLLNPSWLKTTSLSFERNQLKKLAQRFGKACYMTEDELIDEINKKEKV